VSWVQVIAVGPDAASFNTTAYTVGTRAVAAPDASTQTKLGVVGDGDGFFFVLESGHSGHRSEDFFLKGTHAVFTQQHGGADVVAIIQTLAQTVAFAT